MAGEEGVRKSSDDHRPRRPHSPEDLDRTLRLTRPGGWIALATVGVILLAVVLWSVAGTATFRSEGLGVLLRRQSTISNVIATANGIVTELSVDVGEEVRRGTPLARMSFPSREAGRDAQAALVRELEGQIARQERFLEDDIPRRRANLAKKIASIEQTMQANEQLVQFLSDLYETQKEELTKGYITRQQVEQTLNSLHSTQASVRDSRNQIRSLETSLDEYVNSSTQSLAQLAERLISSRQSLETMNVSLAQDSLLVSPAQGRVVGLEANLGERIEAGNQVVTIESAGGSLTTVGYFRNAEGKKIHPGMEAFIAPLSVQRDIFGTIRGWVHSVSPVSETEQELLRIFGNEALVAQLMSGGAPIQTEILLEQDSSTPSGLSWTSVQGPPEEITPGTTAEVRVTVRTQRPIELLLPILRTWTQ